MKPVALTLYILQGESSVQLGFLLPTLHNVGGKLKKLESTCKVCTPLIDALQDWIQKHFGEMTKEPELLAAAVEILDHRGEHLKRWSIYFNN